MLPGLPVAPLDSGPLRRTETGPPAVSGPGAVPALGAIDPSAQRSLPLPVGPATPQDTRVQAEPRGLEGLRPPPGRPAAADAALVGKAAAIAPQLQRLAVWLQVLAGTESAGDTATGSAAAAVQWPPAGEPVAATPDAALLRLREALGQSPLFAANPRTAATLLALAQAPWGSAPSPDGALLAQPLGTPADAKAPAAAASIPAPAADRGGRAVPDAPSAANPGSGATAAPPLPLFQPSAQGAAAGADAVTQALQLLLHGQLRWQGELTAGVPASLARDDFWAQDPEHPERLLTGTTLRVELTLPRLGRLVVVGQQLGGALAVHLEPAPGQQLAVDAALSELQQLLAPLSAQPVAVTLTSHAGPPT
jgi:hypothetical protein